MKLQLAVNGKVLSSIPVNETLAGNEDYLKAVRRLLIMRHRKDLHPNTEPNFYLESSKPAGKLITTVPVKA